MGFSRLFSVSPIEQNPSGANDVSNSANSLTLNHLRGTELGTQHMTRFPIQFSQRFGHFFRPFSRPFSRQCSLILSPQLGRSLASFPFSFLGIGIATLGLCFGIGALPAIAHHPMGGQTPTDFLSGLLSGIGHPVIGLDHFTFVIAVGLAATFQPQGWMILLAFTLASLGGTGIHLGGLNLPIPEVIIALSVLGMGALLVRRSRLNSGWMAALVGVAGVFHGYAYGESIVGAEMTPLLAYLVGFSGIQLAIALAAQFTAQRCLSPILHRPNPDLHASILPLRFVGFIVCGAGVVFLSSALWG